MTERDNRRTPRMQGSAVYGVYGVMEWVALVPVGRSTLKIHFEGGSMSGYGIRPATYETDHPGVRRIIERSEWYRRGRIKLIGFRPYPHDGDGKEERR